MHPSTLCHPHPSINSPVCLVPTTMWCDFPFRNKYTLGISSYMNHVFMTLIHIWLALAFVITFHSADYFINLLFINMKCNWWIDQKPGLISYHSLPFISLALGTTENNRFGQLGAWIPCSLKTIGYSLTFYLFRPEWNVNHHGYWTKLSMSLWHTYVF